MYLESGVVSAIIWTVENEFVECRRWIGVGTGKDCDNFSLKLKWMENWWKYALVLTAEYPMNQNDFAYLNSDSLQLIHERNTYELSHSISQHCRGLLCATCVQMSGNYENEAKSYTIHAVNGKGIDEIEWICPHYFYVRVRARFSAAVIVNYMGWICDIERFFSPSADPKNEKRWAAEKLKYKLKL